MNKQNQGIIFLLIAFMALGLAYAVINPLHEATDELRHYRFVRYIVQEGALPVQGQGACRAQSHHPPLYYLLGAAATAWVDTGRDICYEPPINPFWNYRYWEVGVDNKNQYLHGPAERFPWPAERRAALLMRLVNLLLGALTVWLTWAIGRAIWPKRPFLALGGAAIVAFNPMFIYMAAAVNNDVIAAAAGGAILLASVRLLQDGADLSWRWGLLFGLLYGLALMSKFNLAAIGLVVATAVTFVAWQKKQWRGWLQVGLASTAVTLLVAGWWFVRNQLLYGELSGFETMTALWGGRDPSQSFWLAVSEIPYAWTSLWGRFGFGQIPLPDRVYDGLRWLTRFALLGLFVPLLRGRDLTEWREAGLALALLPLTVLIFTGVLFNYMLVSTAGPMGRFFFPALPALGLLLAYGLSQWPRLLLAQTQWTDRATAVSVAIAMFLFALVALLGYLAPAYARPPTWPETAVSDQAIAQFDTFITLRDYKISSTNLIPGQPLDLDLYWEVNARPPGDYYFFVHLIDQFGNLITQRDTHPGLGRFPSSQWQPGDRFVESIRIYLPETAYVPATARLSIGFYAPGGGYRLGITAVDGTGLGDALELATIGVMLPPDSSAVVPNPQQWQFENGAKLVGYEYNNRQFKPDDVFTIDLYWQPPSAGFSEAEVWVQLIDQQGHMRAFAQANLADLVGTETAVMQLATIIPPDLTVNSYRVELYLLDSVTKEPHHLVADDGRLINNYVDLAPVAITSN